MKLVLTMIQGPESGRKREVDAVSLTVGRGEENGWAVADPTRVLSKQHFKIDFREGQYILTDTSTNGVFVNGAATALGRDRQVMLNKGDRIGVGIATFSVDLVKPSAEEDPFLAALTKPPETPALPLDDDDPFAPLPGSPSSVLPPSVLPPAGGGGGSVIPDDFDLDLPPRSGDPLATRGIESPFASPLPPPASGAMGGGSAIPDDWLGGDPGAPAMAPMGGDALIEAVWRLAQTASSLHPDSAVASSPVSRAGSPEAVEALLAGPGGEQTLRRLFADLQELVLRP